MRTPRAYLAEIGRRGGEAAAAKRRKPCVRCGAAETALVYRRQVDPDRRVRLCPSCAEASRTRARAPAGASVPTCPLCGWARSTAGVCTPDDGAAACVARSRRGLA